MKRLTATFLLLTLFCQPLCSCRTTLYRAAEKGDYATVKQELQSGVHPDHALSGEGTPITLLVLPVFITTMAIDICSLLPMAFVSGIIGDKSIMERPLTSSYFMKTPSDAALDYGHHDVARLLQAYGGQPIFDKHYYGDFSTPATQEPKAPRKQTVQTTPQKKEKITPPRASQNKSSEAPMPQPGIGGAAGSISTH